MRPVPILLAALSLVTVEAAAQEGAGTLNITTMPTGARSSRLASLPMRSNSGSAPVSRGPYARNAFSRSCSRTFSIGTILLD